MLRRWLGRVSVGFFASLALLVAVGASYEAISRHLASARYLPTGRLVDIGGRKIHLDCRGEGSPTVIFEAGLDNYGTLSWIKVHDAVSKITRACTYDRAGIMWSDPKTTPQHADAVADDLHAVLAAAGENKPFVLVAHSLGGPYSMAYTRKFSDEVVGLVFVDASHPDQVARFSEVMSVRPDPSAQAVKIVASLAWTGIIRFLAPTEGAPDAPVRVIEQSDAYISTSLQAVVSEKVNINQTLAEAGALRTLGHRPLVVLTALAPLSDATLKLENMSRLEEARRREVWRRLHDDEASWSTRSRHELLPSSPHFIQFARPDVVISAIREVVSIVRSD